MLKQNRNIVIPHIKYEPDNSPFGENNLNGFSIYHNKEILLNILMDVDDCVLDLVGALLKRYNAEYDDHLTIDQVTDWDISKFVKCGKEVYKYFKDPSIYDDIEVIPFALEGVKLLRLLGHRVVFCTYAYNEVAGLKFRTLVRLGFLDPDQHEDYVEAKDKSLFAPTMVMVDDRPHYLETFTGVAIAFTKPWNKDLKFPFRANNWMDLCTLFKALDQINKPEIVQ